MKKTLLSFFAIAAALCAKADEVTFDFHDGENRCITETEGYLNKDITIGDVTLTLSGTNACHVLNPAATGYQLTLYKSAIATKVGTIQITAKTGVVKKVEFTGVSFINDSFTYDCGDSYETGDRNNGNPTKAVWEGDEPSVTFQSTLGNANIHTVKVTIGEPSLVKSPVVTPNGGTLYAGVNNVITATCATEGATVMYKADGGEYQQFPAEGVTVTESATYTFQSVLGEAKSSEKICTYNVVTPVEVTKASDIFALADGATVKVNADLSVVTCDTWNKYAFLGTNAAGDVIPVKVSANIAEGSVVKGGWMATFTKTGGTSYDSYLTVILGAIETTGETASFSVPAVTVPTALTDATLEYNRVVIRNVSIAKTSNYNYDLTDKAGNMIHSYEQWGSSFPKSLDAAKTYNVEGILVTTLDGRQIYPIAVEEYSEPAITFDFSAPATYGYASPELDGYTNFADGDVLTAGGVTITNVKNGVVSVPFFGTTTYYTRFANTEESGIELQIREKTVVTIAAPEGQVITGIEFTGSSLAGSKTFDCGTYNITETGAAWCGADALITLTGGDDFCIKTMKVTLAEAPKVAYPVFSSVGDVLYRDVTTPKTITLSCATEGATIKYRMSEDAQWTDYTDAGISITETCTVWAKAVAGADESAVVFASYTVQDVPTVNTAAEFAAIADEVVCKTGTDLVVAHHWKSTYYNIILAVDAEGGVFYINDKDPQITEQLPAGTIIEAGLAGKMHAAGYMSHKPDFQPVSDIRTKEGTVLPEAADVTLSTVEGRYGKLLKIQNVNIDLFINASTNKPLANNYVLSDQSDVTLRLYNRYAIDMNSLEDGKYDITGILINNGSMDQFFPISFQKSLGTGIESVEDAIAVEQDGKYLEQSRIVIIKGGKKYNVAGQTLK